MTALRAGMERRGLEGTGRRDEVAKQHILILILELAEVAQKPGHLSLLSCSKITFKAGPSRPPWGSNLGKQK